MAQPLAIAVDVMSGDLGCEISVRGAMRAKQTHPEIDLILVGDTEQIKQHLRSDDQDGFTLAPAAGVVAMDEIPARAIRRRDTSMRRALELVAEGRAAAAVSAGNTGALLGLGAVLLKITDGIDRPAIASFIPNRNATDYCCMLDLGANVECTPKMLEDFAIMGSALYQAVRGIATPRVGLLNIGEEAFKGTKNIKEASDLLEQNARINFIGNVEGYDIFHGSADVIVCDGFTGNIALKVTEGLAQMLAGIVKTAFTETLLARACGVLALPVINRLRNKLDHRPYNGACFLGLNGIVVKSHGNADAVAFAAAIEYAVRSANQNVPQIIKESIVQSAGASPSTPTTSNDQTAADGTAAVDKTNLPPAEEARATA